MTSNTERAERAKRMSEKLAGQRSSDSRTRKQAVLRIVLLPFTIITHAAKKIANFIDPE